LLFIIHDFHALQRGRKILLAIFWYHIACNSGSSEFMHPIEYPRLPDQGMQSTSIWHGVQIPWYPHDWPMHPVRHGPTPWGPIIIWSGAHIPIPPHSADITAAKQEPIPAGPMNIDRGVQHPIGPQKALREARQVPTPPVPMSMEGQVQHPIGPQKTLREARQVPTPPDPMHMERGAQHPIEPRQGAINEAQHVPSPPNPRHAVMQPAAPVTITPNNDTMKVNIAGSIFSSMFLCSLYYLYLPLFCLLSHSLSQNQLERQKPSLQNIQNWLEQPF
jgi:hypothetical protein